MDWSTGYVTTGDCCHWIALMLMKTCQAGPEITRCFDNFWADLRMFACNELQGRWCILQPIYKRLNHSGVSVRFGGSRNLLLKDFKCLCELCHSHRLQPFNISDPHQTEDHNNNIRAHNVYALLPITDLHCDSLPVFFTQTLCFQPTRTTWFTWGCVWCSPVIQLISFMSMSTSNRCENHPQDPNWRFLCFLCPTKTPGLFIYCQEKQQTLKEQPALVCHLSINWLINRAVVAALKPACTLFLSL